jgi:hypothetical protein
MRRVSTNTLILTLLAALVGSCARSDAPPVQASAVRSSAAPPPKADSAPAVSPAPQPPVAAPSDPYRIWELGVGSVRLGMSLADVRREHPNARFERTSDGDGADLVYMQFGKDSSLVLYANEAATDSTIDWSGIIEHIETFSEAFHTAENIRVGSLVTDVERFYGKTRDIALSEIESRQFISFEKQPKGLEFRIDYTGKFEGDSRNTKVFEPGAKIFSIAVSR